MSPYLLLGVLSLAGYFYSRDAIGAEITVHTDSFTKYDDLFKKYSRISGIPWRYIKAVAFVESDLGRDSRAFDIEKSIDGKSVGIMQTILTTSNEVRPGTSLDDLIVPEISIDVGSRILKRNRKKFPLSWEYTIRAYNGGLGFMSTVAGQRDTPKYWQKFLDRLSDILKQQPGDELEIG